ncbi:hypothetical protein, partial [Acidithiobacillus ferrianus]|uniref:hypothetical protein n=1 Tax=Acidithiobacillus ferrianus TaxID=2678518 RepID=UPI0034E44D9D
RAGTVRDVERWKFRRDEARNSRHSRIGLAGAVHDDKPVEVRVNRRGNKELRDQKCIQRLIGFSNITKASELYQPDRGPECTSNLAKPGDKSRN